MSYPGQYPNFTFQFDQSYQSIGNDSWTPTPSNSWEPNSNLNQSYQSWEPNSNHVVSNEFYQGDSNYFQSFTPYTSDYWDPNQTTSDYMGPNHFNPPLDSYQESWAQTENFDSNSLLPNQNGEWISQSYDPYNLEPSYSYPPPSEEPIDKLEQMMRGMENSLFELQKLRAQVEMMCQACTPANDSPSEIGNPYHSNVIIPISSSDHKEDHIPDYSLNQNQKEYDFNFTYLDTSSPGEDIFNSNLLSSCQFKPQHNHLEIETQLKNHDAPHFNSSNQIHHDPYFVSPYDLQIDSHINTYLIGRMLEDSEPELLLDHLNNDKLDKCDHIFHSDIHFSSPTEHEKINFESYTPIPILPHDSIFSRINPIDQEHSLTKPNFLWDHEFFILPSQFHNSWNLKSWSSNIGYKLDQLDYFYCHSPKVIFSKNWLNCNNYHLDLGDKNHIIDDVMTDDSTFPFDPGGVICMSG